MPRHRDDIPDGDELARLVAEGQSQASLALVYGCAEGTISSRLAQVRPPAPRRDRELLLLVDDGETWQERAVCTQTDPEAFFPEKGRNSDSNRIAKKVCLSCEVRSACLQYALDNEERFGIWGGLSERERRKLKKKPA